MVENGSKNRVENRFFKIDDCESSKNEIIFSICLMIVNILILSIN